MKKEKIIWALDLAINLNNCRKLKLEEKFIRDFAQEVGEKIDPSGEIIGIVNEFGNHDENMKGLRIIHETQNCLITGHIVEKNKNLFLNVHSCRGYRPSEVLKIITDKLDPENYSCQKIFRE